MKLWFNFRQRNYQCSELTSKNKRTNQVQNVAVRQCTYNCNQPHLNKCSHNMASRQIFLCLMTYTRTNLTLSTFSKELTVGENTKKVFDLNHAETSSRLLIPYPGTRWTKITVKWIFQKGLEASPGVISDKELDLGDDDL